MFTGLIESVGTVTGIARTPAGIELRIECPWSDLDEGESISINGACLTVLDKGDGWFKAAAMVMTISRTTIGDWEIGRQVNIERAMRADSRFGGHIVQGHVDGVALVTAITRDGDALLMTVAVPDDLRDTIVLHGSVALDGVSLTVNRLEGANLQVALIDYTIANTALGNVPEGGRVNVETDVVGKYVRGLVAPYLNR